MTKINIAVIAFISAGAIFSSYQNMFLIALFAYLIGITETEIESSYRRYKESDGEEI